MAAWYLYGDSGTLVFFYDEEKFWAFPRNKIHMDTNVFNLGKIKEALTIILWHGKFAHRWFYDTSLNEAINLALVDAHFKFIG